MDLYDDDDDDERCSSDDEQENMLPFVEASTPTSSTIPEKDPIQQIIDYLATKSGKCEFRELNRFFRADGSFMSGIGHTSLRKFIDRNNNGRFQFSTEGTRMIELSEPGSFAKFSPFEINSVLNADIDRVWESTCTSPPMFKEEELRESLDRKVLGTSSFSSLNFSPWTHDEISRQVAHRRVCRSSEKYARFLQTRGNLPAFKAQKEIISSIQENNVTLVFGLTGSGKTTQVPQFILDSFLDSFESGSPSTEPERGCSILITQPRRISAISVAQRVSEERAEHLKQSVGYQIRFEHEASSMTRMMYVTTGILLRRLESDPLLKGITHVIVDEVHERDLMADFSLFVLRDLVCGRRRDLKLILMSATLDQETFISYFTSPEISTGVISIPGMLYDVQEFYIEDILPNIPYCPPDALSTRQAFHGRKAFHSKAWRNKREGMSFLDDKWGRFSSTYRDFQGHCYDENVIKSLFDLHVHVSSQFGNNPLPYDLIESLLEVITEGGTLLSPDSAQAVLIFVPGWSAISDLMTLLGRNRKFASQWSLLPLHSMVPTHQQRAIFEHASPGKIKVVISTNIAETSITIDDVTHVIDCGYMNETSYNPMSNIMCLQPQKVSKANAMQRKGRSGRVQEGFCYRLYSRLEYESFDDYTLPEMVRTPVEELILKVKCLNLGNNVRSILGQVITPPSKEALDNGLNLLSSMGALDHEDSDEFDIVELTPLGKILSSLPIHPLLAKALMMSAFFGTLDCVLSVVSFLSSTKPPFNMVIGKERLVDERRKEIAGGSGSDHWLAIELWRQWNEAKEKGGSFERDWCFRNFVNGKAMTMMSQLRNQLQSVMIDVMLPIFPRKTSLSRILSIANRNCSGSKNEVDYLMRATLTLGFHPHLVRFSPSRKKTPSFHDSIGSNLSLFTSCVNGSLPWPGSMIGTGFAKLKTSNISIRDFSPVDPVAVLALSGLPLSLRSGSQSRSHLVEEDGKYASSVLVTIVGTSFRIRLPSRVFYQTQDIRERFNILLHSYINLVAGFNSPLPYRLNLCLEELDKLLSLFRFGVNRVSLFPAQHVPSELVPTSSNGVGKGKFAGMNGSYAVFMEIQGRLWKYGTVVPNFHVLDDTDYSNVTDSFSTRIALLIPSIHLDPSNRRVEGMPLVRSLVSSLVQTVPKFSDMYSYELYIGIPEDDPDFDDEEVLRVIDSLVSTVQHSDGILMFAKFFFIADYTQSRSSWTYNHLMKTAYEDGCDFFFQLSDSCVFRTAWIEKLVGSLKGSTVYRAFGVSAPTVLGRDTDSMVIEHVMVHRSHFEIFGSFFPSTIDYPDTMDFLTHVYGFRSTYWFSDIVIDDGNDSPSITEPKSEFLSEMIEQGRLSVISWLKDQHLSVGRFLTENHYYRWDVKNTASYPKVHERKINKGV